MKGAILGFQKRVWCPKWTPASSISRMVTGMERLRRVGSRIRRESRGGDATLRLHPTAPRHLSSAGSRLIYLAPGTNQAVDTQINPKSIAAGSVTAAEVLRSAIEAGDSPACRHAFIRRFDATAQTTAQLVDR